MVSFNLTEENIAYWNELFARRPRWSRYPPEDLAGFIARTFPAVEQRCGLRALDVGCGPGSNLWFLAREGFTVAGIDGSANAIDSARARLRAEGLAASLEAADLQVGVLSGFPGRTARSMLSSTSRRLFTIRCSRDS